MPSALVLKQAPETAAKYAAEALRQLEAAKRYVECPRMLEVCELIPAIPSGVMLITKHM